MNKLIVIIFTLFSLNIKSQEVQPKIIEFKIYTHFPFNVLTWTIPKQTNDMFFEIEKSYDNVNFVKVGETSYSGIYWNFKTYEYSDIDTTLDPIYYRLTLIKTTYEVVCFKEKTTKNR
jgi:hypothetical protein